MAIRRSGGREDGGGVEREVADLGGGAVDANIPNIGLVAGAL